MKKMSIKRFWQIIMTVTLCCATTACGDDNNNEPEAPVNTDKSLNYAKVNYSIELPQDVVDLWDVEVSYTDAKGETAIEKLNSRNTWTSSIAWDTKSTPVEAIPEKVTMSVVGKPKANVNLDPDKLYNLGKKYNVSVNMIYNNGKTDGNGGSMSTELSASGSKLTEAVKKNRDIMSAITLEIPHTYNKK